jgi:hypothetical protein
MWRTSTCGLLAALVLSGCNSDPSDEPDGIRVVAQEDVMISQTPLGDVGSGDLESGDEATATCFVKRARAQVGAIGSAIEVRVGDVTGYAAVTDFPKDPADRRQMFNLDAETLAERLPACPR